MQLLSQNYINPNDLQIGMKVYLTQEAADMQWAHILLIYKVCNIETEATKKINSSWIKPGGYEVLKINKYIIPKGIVPSKLHLLYTIQLEGPPATCTIYHEDGTMHHTTFLECNTDGELVVGYILENRVFNRVFRTVDELSKVNNTRHTCIVCGKQLNILSVNLRFCSTCENTLVR